MSEALKRDYVVGKEIGRGQFGVVFQCFSVVSGEAFAVKSIAKSRITDPGDRKLIHREAKVTSLAGAGNPHVIQIHSLYEDDKYIHLVLDLLHGPDLLDRMIAHGPFAEPAAAEIIVQLAQGIAVCHSRGIAHRDVKPENVMFDAAGRLRLLDFGGAEWFGDGRPMRGFVGTPYYLAPEVLEGREYGEKVDVWSAGVVLYMLLGNMPPFGGGGSEGEILNAVERAELLFPSRFFDKVSPLAKDLIGRMICKDVPRRLSAEQVLRHPWILTRGGSISS